MDAKIRWGELDEDDGGDLDFLLSPGGAPAAAKTGRSWLPSEGGRVGGGRHEVKASTSFSSSNYYPTAPNPHHDAVVDPPSIHIAVLSHPFARHSSAYACAVIGRAQQEGGTTLGYGFEKPSDIQQRAVIPIISGRDVIAQDQSGIDKTSMISLSVCQVIDTNVHK
ncbi:hypothetical protein ZWY2020_058620 [Hordeum vulgare]|nr:hypothetical protein ZWY2020_058620 [Hordeum vulgare]